MKLNKNIMIIVMLYILLVIIVVVKTLYDNKYNVFYNASGDKYLNSYVYKIDNNELVLAHDNKFYIYKKYELVYESKNEYKEIYNVFDSFIAVNKDGYLTLKIIMKKKNLKCVK